MPLSDAAGCVTAVGDGVVGVSVGDRVVTHAVIGWLDGPFHDGLHQGDPTAIRGCGVAAEEALWPGLALRPVPQGWSCEEAAALPVAALTAWSALMAAAGLRAGQSVLTLGTGRVSLFALQIAKSLGARVIITSGNDEKLARARALGADHGINDRRPPPEVRSGSHTGRNAGRQRHSAPCAAGPGHARIPCRSTRLPAGKPEEPQATEMRAEHLRAGTTSRS